MSGCLSSFTFLQASVPEEIEQKVDKGFAEHAIQQIGFDGEIQSHAWLAYQNEQFAGMLTYKFFWKALQIRKLYIEPKYRKLGLGTRLLQASLQHAKDYGCTFALVETMNFQALEFYKKQGFKVSFSQEGFANGAVFHYLRLDF